MAETEDRQRLLIAFDFDHSLIDENSDLYVIKLAPGGKLPDEIKDLYRDDGWTEYMAEIFKYLHLNGNTPENILQCMSEIPLTDGMKDLIDFTKSTGLVDHIIISDANSVFIEHILHNHKLAPHIFKTFTNPACFNDKGCLTLKYYHTQDWCTLSTINLCKGHILKEFIDLRQKNDNICYSHVLYVGDGYNDLCPGLTLRPQDFLMPRVGFTLHKVVEKMAKKNKPVPRSELQAKVIPWKTGQDILQHLKAVLVALKY